MAKRVYQPKPQPLSTQILIQRAVVENCEKLLAMAISEAATVANPDADHGIPCTVEQANERVANEELCLRLAREKLAALQAQAE